MPELPEVETTRRGIEPHVQGQRLGALRIGNARLRWPVSPDLPQQLLGQPVEAVERRAKYLLLRLPKGTLMIHLGMSGSLRLVPQGTAVGKHDHLDLPLSSDLMLRYTDPRRFGAWLWTTNPAEHPLLLNLGPEPLSEDFSGATLYQASRRRRQAIKPFIMDNHVVVGVGNIYATEALFAVGIDPRRPAQSLSQAECDLLAAHIQRILAQAIDSGGTTLRDFVGGDGRPGYFQQTLQVYGRAGQACNHCGTLLQSVLLGQRTSVFCPQCQH